MSNEGDLPARADRLAGRLAVCQLAGTLAALVIGDLVGSVLRGPSSPIMGSAGADLLTALVFALAFGIPFYAAALLILLAMRTAVIRHTFAWSIVVPSVLLCVSLIAFSPIRLGGVHWMSLVALAATFAGIVFYLWQHLRPMTPIV